MLAEIITIGDELLIGQVVDTNSAWMGQQLNLAGISVRQITSVSDDPGHIVSTLDQARLRADLILMTGGLGPTKDDITKHTLCAYFKTQLVFSDEVYEQVKALFASLGKEVTAINRKQAEVPAACRIIPNRKGTAPGMWFEQDGKIFISMPGVPYEMKAMMSGLVIPALKERFELPHIIHKTILTQGVGESFLSEIIAEWENSLGEEQIKLAYLPSPGQVRLRMSLTGTDRKKMEEALARKTAELGKLISRYIYGEEEYGAERETLAHVAGRLLRERKQSVCTAESCTGGYIAHLITSVPGSSDYYYGSVIAYANQVKVEQLGVDEQVLREKGAVSRETVEQMAEGARKKFNTDYALAVSGIAGPDGGTPDKPVGTVWIAVASAKGVVAEQFLFGKDRERNIQKAAQAALNMLRKEIL
ncbi:MAG: competence/damage-inducible protein A [Bacteroidota bacterium]